MSNSVTYVPAHTFHGRKGKVENSFRYSIDYVLIEPENRQRSPFLFSHGRANIMGFRERDHGGVPGQGTSTLWVRDRLSEFQLPQPARIALLTQPRVLGYVFNPVSFWLCYDAEDNLIVVVAEVTNTFGNRHSYLCHKPDVSPIGSSDRLRARKLLHVSPFQPREGDYEFRFDIREDRIGIWIDYGREKGGLIATLTGKPRVLRNRDVLRSLLRRPLGARRVMGLIHWQAIKLWFKGAGFRSEPKPLDPKVSRG